MREDNKPADKPRPCSSDCYAEEHDAIIRMAEIFVTAYVRTRPEILSECGDTVEQAVQFGLMVGFAEGMEWIIKEMPIGDE